MTTLDDVFSTNAPGYFSKNSQPGDTLSGTVVDAVVRQTRDFRTGEAERWDDGNPKQQVVVKVQTDLRDDADDDGVRALYIKTWGTQREALTTAIREAGAKTASEALAPGSTITATFTGTRPSQVPGGSDEKLYVYRITRAASNAVNAAVSPPPAAAPPAFAQPVTPPPAPAQAAPAAPPAPAPAAPPAKNPADLARDLFNLGMTDDQVAAATSLDVGVVAALRNASA